MIMTKRYYQRTEDVIICFAQQFNDLRKQPLMFVPSKQAVTDKYRKML